MIKHFIYNLSKNDPGAHVLSIVAKVGVIMFIYFLFAWSMGLVYEVIIWVFYFLAFAAMVCEVGDIYSRRKIFILFWCGFSVALSMSYWLHPYKIMSFAMVVMCAYVAFWLRKYGGVYKTFPGYLVIVLAISAIQLPVVPAHLVQLYLSLIAVGISFFILILVLRPWDTPRQLLRVLQMHAVLLQKESKYCLENILKISGEEFNLNRAQKELSKRLETLHGKGASWIISPKRKLVWHKCYSRYHTLMQSIFRILFFYQALLKKQSTVADDIAKKAALKDIVYLTTKLPIWILLITKEEDFNTQINQFKNYSESFKQEVLAHTSINGCQVVLLELVLLLEGLCHVSYELREAMYEL